VLGGPDGKQLYQSREVIVKDFAEDFADILDCTAKLGQQMLHRLKI
jgi:hypothetical protein